MEQIPNSLPEQKYKNPAASFEFGSIGIFLGVLIFILFFLTLNYFNVLSLSTLYPKTFGWLPHQSSTTPQTNNQQANLPPEQPVSADSVSAVSDVPGYTLTITDKTDLISLIQRLRIIGRTYNQLANPVKVTNLFFHLSNQEGTKNKFFVDSNGKALFSSDYIFSDSTLNLNIYLNPESLKNKDSGLYNAAAISNLYDLSLTKSVSTADEVKSILQLSDEINRKNQKFFQIEATNLK